MIRSDGIIRMNMRRVITAMLMTAMAAAMWGCGSKSSSPENGIYMIEVELSGGTGRTSIESPTLLMVEDGSYTGVITFSSPNYDYMIVGTEKYLPGGYPKYEGYPEGVLPDTENSRFIIPVGVLDEEIEVVADTTAMSKPHEIEYTLLFRSDTIKKAD